MWNSASNAIDPLGLEPWLPQGTTNERPSPSPVGLFPDGSVRTLDSGMSPQVLDLLNKGGSGPVIPPHIPGSPLAFSPTPSTVRPWTLTQNFPFGTGDLIYSYQSVSICKAASTQTSREIYNRMKSFTYFGQGNIAGVSTVTPGAFEPLGAQGRTFALFVVRGVSSLAQPKPVGAWQTRRNPALIQLIFPLSCSTTMAQ